MVCKAGVATGDFSGIRVVVPHIEHARLLKAALASHLQRSFIAPRITTMRTWLAQLPLGDNELQALVPPARMMALYAEMRRHPWLKQLFHAQRNTDLLPVAHALLSLFDELSEAVLPLMPVGPETSEESWRTALAQLPVPAHGILSNEARLVWTLWQSQFDRDDPQAIRLARMKRLADSADAPLVWISSGRPDPLGDAFLEAYAKRCPVLPVMPDWRGQSLAPAYALAWPEVLGAGAGLEQDEAQHAATAAHAGTDPGLTVSLHAAHSLEDEARHAAQTVIQWLNEGKTRIAVIAQDRAAAWRLRSLLKRAEVVISDETGWELSTTRCAAMLTALLNVVTTRADSLALLDLLKCPGLCADFPDKAELVMQIERVLRRANVIGGWNAVLGSMAGQPRARMLLMRIAEHAWLFTGRKSLREWAGLTESALRALGMRDEMEADAAGMQLLALLDTLIKMDGPRARFGFAEWRAMLGVELESMTRHVADCGSGVVFLQLNDAQLRRFDAVIMVGAGQTHLPSPAEDTLVFANTVRRELDLAAYNAQQRMQLRDFAELLNANPHVVLCWQAWRDGEPNAMSHWIERLQLVLELTEGEGLPPHYVNFPERRLSASPPRKPRPAAPDLLPAVISASAYNSLTACPYQFFATHMLGLAPLEELTELPDKRDYGSWLHAILKAYHETIRDNAVEMAAREGVLRDITDKIFTEALAPGSTVLRAVALGYYSRWQKAIPAYLAWANEREANGWRFAFGDQILEKIVEWEGGQVVLRGRVDRIDEHHDGSRAMLDYKTQRLQVLRDRLKDGEDQYLAFYAVLSDSPVAAGHFVALEPSLDRTGDATAEHFTEWQSHLESQIGRDMRAIANGAPLPAAGIERICIHCGVRGLCRKGTW